MRDPVLDLFVEIVAVIRPTLASPLGKQKLILPLHLLILSMARTGSEDRFSKVGVHLPIAQHILQVVPHRLGYHG